MTADHRHRRRSIFRECLPFTPPPAPVSEGIEQASNGSERAKAEDEAKGGRSVVSGQNSGPKKSTLAAQKTIHEYLTYLGHQGSIKPSRNLRSRT